jgi:hypothetical protein
VNYVVAFLRFWYDFVVGDDGWVAVGIGLGIGLTAVVASADVASWWVMPVVVAVTAVASLRRAVASD